MALPPYTPDPDDPLTPPDTELYGFAAAELRALKAKINSQQTGSIPSPTSGTAAAYAVSLFPDAPDTNTVYSIIPHVDNADGATLTPGAGVALPIVQKDGVTPVIAGMLRANARATLLKLANSWMLLDPATDELSIQHASRWDKTSFLVDESSEFFAIARSLSTKDTILAYNCYFDGTVWRYSSAGFASFIIFNALVNNVAVYVSDQSGATDGAITWITPLDMGGALSTLQGTVNVAGRLSANLHVGYHELSETADNVLEVATLPTLADGDRFQVYGPVGFALKPYGNAREADPGVLAPTLNGLPLKVSPNFPMLYTQLLRSTLYTLQYFSANGGYFVVTNPSEPNMVYDEFREYLGVLDSHTAEHGIPITRTQLGVYNLDTSDLFRVSTSAHIFGYVTTYLTGAADRRAHTALRHLTTVMLQGVNPSIEIHVRNNSGALVDLNDETLRIVIPIQSPQY